MHVAICVLHVLIGIQSGEPKKPAAPKAEPGVQPEAGWKKMGRSLWFDPKERRMYLQAKVVLQGGLS